VDSVDLISEELWDHYSGLPNPAWYQYKKKLNNGKENEEDIIDLGNVNEKIQTQEKKYMGSVEISLAPTYDPNLRLYSFDDTPGFTPSYSPVEMVEAGVFGGNYFGNIEVKHNWLEFVPSEFVDKCNTNKLINPQYNKSLNKYGVACGMDYQGWINSGWIKEQDPYGWFNWYINFYYGRRSLDDDRQISRWRSFTGRHSGMLKSMCLKKKVSTSDESISPKTRQGLLHWAYTIN
jgi:hypothetical protein